MIGSTLDEPGAASVSDEVLMKDISRRHPDALGELYGRHRKRLRATIDGVVHEEAEADDVLQEIFLQVWEEAARYSSKAGKPLGWMVPSRAVALSTDCAGARLILAPGSATRNE